MTANGRDGKHIPRSPGHFRTNDDVEFADIGETPAGQCVAYIHQPQAKIQYHHEFVGSR